MNLRAWKTENTLKQINYRIMCEVSTGFPYLGQSARNQFESLPSPHFQVLQGQASPAPTTDYAGDLEPAQKGWVIWHLKTKQNKKHYTIWSENQVFFFNLL